MIVLIDNYDSFVYNLARYFELLGQRTAVVRNDVATVDRLRSMRPEGIVISPGPCTPAEAGNSLAIVRSMHREVPILGVCLGHQVIAEAFGAKVVRARHPMHGQTSSVEHPGTGLFAGVESPTEVCRYHSLVVERESLPAELQVTAWTGDGICMAIAHVELPVRGVQFHPEAILTRCGYQVLANFLRLSGLPVAGECGELAESELVRTAVCETALPERPVTF